MGIFNRVKKWFGGIKTKLRRKITKKVVRSVLPEITIAAAVVATVLAIIIYPSLAELILLALALVTVALMVCDAIDTLLKTIFGRV